MKATAEANKYAMEQEAEGIRKRGLAEAEAIRAKALAEAEGIQLKGDYVYFGISDKSKSDRACIYSIPKSVF